MCSPGLYVLTSGPNHPQKAIIYLLCRTGALSLDNDEWRPTNSSSLVTMFGLTRGLAMSFRASIVWADTAQRHQAPSDLYLPLPSSLMDELLAPRSQPSAVHTAAPRYTLSPYGGNRSQRNVNESFYRVWQAPECGSRLYVFWPQLLRSFFFRTRTSSVSQQDQIIPITGRSSGKE